MKNTLQPASKVQVTLTYTFITHDTDSCDRCELYPYCEEIENLECVKADGYYELEDKQVKIIES